MTKKFLITLATYCLQLKNSQTVKYIEDAIAFSVE